MVGWVKVVEKKQQLAGVRIWVNRERRNSIFLHGSWFEHPGD